MSRCGLSGIMFLLLLAGCSDDASNDSSQDGGGGTGGTTSEAGVDASGGSTPDADTTDGESPDADASMGDPLCPQVAEQQCALMARCMPGWMVLSFGDEASCVAQTQADCDIRLSAPGVNVTGQEWLACANEMNSVDTCETYFLRAFYDDPPFTSCDFTAGTKADGESCLSYFECQSGNCDTGYQAEPACGTCQPALFRTCTDGNKCGADELCSYPSGTSGPSECVTAAKVGESCEDVPCLDGAPCDNGVCPAPIFGKEGASCDASVPYNFYISWGCSLFDYYCDGTTQTCQPMPTPGAVGEACVSDGMFSGFCVGESQCNGDGICEADIPWGEACDEDRCLYPARCIEGTCQMPSLDTCE